MPPPGLAHRSLCRAGATSVCRWRSPGPVCCVAFVRGVIKARLKTRASISAARRLTSAAVAGLSAGAESSPGPRSELRSRGPAVKVTEKRRPGAAGQPGRCRSFPGCVGRALPSAWPLLSRRRTSPGSLRALGSLHRTCPRFPCAKPNDSLTAWILIATTIKNSRNAALSHYFLFKRGILLGKEHVPFP